MKPLFEVSVVDQIEIHDMPDTWCDDDYRILLKQLDMDDIEELFGLELFEMLIMALQDKEPSDAADIVLAYKIEKEISAGARQNIVYDLLEGQRPWEEWANISLHSKIFAAAVLLEKAFPSKFKMPDMIQLTLFVKGLNKAAISILSAPPTAAFVARMLADGLDEKSILERLFSDQIGSQHFPEAEAIIWCAKFDARLPIHNSGTNLIVYSSEHWLKAMQTVTEFQSTAYNDATREER